MTRIMYGASYGTRPQVSIEPNKWRRFTAAIELLDGVGLCVTVEAMRCFDVSAAVFSHHSGE